MQSIKGSNQNSAQGVGYIPIGAQQEYQNVLFENEESYNNNMKMFTEVHFHKVPFKEGLKIIHPDLYTNDRIKLTLILSLFLGKWSNNNFAEYLAKSWVSPFISENTASINNIRLLYQVCLIMDRIITLNHLI